MDDIKLAMLGSKEAARRLTEAGVLLACPKCGTPLTSWAWEELRKRWEEATSG